jgi:hypothetical protein
MPPPQVEIPIIHRIFEFYKIFHSYSGVFPKRDKFNIGQKCENYIIEILELIIFASQSSSGAKLPILENASKKLNTLKILIRLLKEIKAIDIKKYVILENFCQEIGKMLGGWIKFIKNK